MCIKKANRANFDLKCSAVIIRKQDLNFTHVVLDELKFNKRQDHLSLLKTHL